MKLIPLTKGLSAIIDDEDYPELMKYQWYAVGKPGKEYAARFGSHDGHQSSQHIRMHRVLMNAPNDVEVDHINGNTLDNRKSNLRLASRAENSRNRTKFKVGGYSMFKGVTYHKRDGYWQAGIKVDGKSVHLGCFKNEIESAKAYNDAALRYFGEFANLNNIMEVL